MSSRSTQTNATAGLFDHRLCVFPVSSLKRGLSLYNHPKNVSVPSVQVHILMLTTREAQREEDWQHFPNWHVVSLQ